MPEGMRPFGSRSWGNRSREAGGINACGRSTEGRKPSGASVQRRKNGVRTLFGRKKGVRTLFLFRLGVVGKKGAGLFSSSGWVAPLNGGLNRVPLPCRQCVVDRTLRPCPSANLSSMYSPVQGDHEQKETKQLGRRQVQSRRVRIDLLPGGAKLAGTCGLCLAATLTRTPKKQS